MSSKLSLFFIVEPPAYQYMACYLAASIRENFDEHPTLIGYCPKHKYSDLDPDVIEVLRRMDVEVRTFEAKGRFNPAYPHGNKLLATLEPRDSEFSGFMDSDILCIRNNKIENIVQKDAVSLTPAASMLWAPQTIWDQIYGACDMDIPEERITLMRQKNRPRIPYFSSGFVTFPEQHRTSQGQSFPEVWMDIAQTVDAQPDINKKRPYLDQMTLPLAIQKAGLKWNLLPEEQHFILGGKLRGKPFPKEREIFTVHYRKWLVLEENQLGKFGKDMLLNQVGVRRVSSISKVPPKTG